MLHVMSGMVDLAHSLNDSNLVLLFEIINIAGPVSDTQAPVVVNESGRKIQRLQEIMRSRGEILGMAVLGLIKVEEAWLERRRN